MEIVMGSVGALIMAGFGFMVIFTMCIWWPITAFLEAWWWGVITFLCPPIFLVFAVLHFQKARKPLIWGIIFTVGCLSVFIARSFLSTFFLLLA